MKRRLRALKLDALVLVVWLDSAFASNGWTLVAERRNPRAVKIATAGWVVRRRKQSVTIAQNVGGLDRQGGPQICNQITIPLGCILETKRL